MTKSQKLDDIDSPFRLGVNRKCGDLCIYMYL